MEKCRNRGVYHALGEGFKTSIDYFLQTKAKVKRTTMRTTPGATGLTEWSAGRDRSANDLLMFLFSNHKY